jgi:hypothetical protein
LKDKVDFITSALLLGKVTAGWGVGVSKKAMDALQLLLLRLPPPIEIHTTTAKKPIPLGTDRLTIN